MKNSKTNNYKLIKAAEKASGSLEHVDIPDWETSESAAQWVRASRRLDNERLERLYKEPSGFLGRSALSPVKRKGARPSKLIGSNPGNPCDNAQGAKTFRRRR